ncbi:MAG: AraC family transcriptional regulator [Mucilaginibacter sp.]
MDQFLFKKNISVEIDPFPQVIEFALRKVTSITLNSMPERVTPFFRIFFIIDGKFDFLIEDIDYTLLPGNVAVIPPGQKIAGKDNILNIGIISWLYVQFDKFDTTGKMIAGKWSTLTKSDCLAMGKILLLTNPFSPMTLKDTGAIFNQLGNELRHQEIGFSSRANSLIDELFIKISRQLIKQNISHRDFPKTFAKLEQSLRENLAYQWTVEEMAAMVGLGTTAFTEKVRAFSGFSPLNYLINIRVAEAIKQLNKTKFNITDIALRTGFYSSQHFATTFKKLTGYTPSEYRLRDNVINKTL